MAITTGSWVRGVLVILLAYAAYQVFDFVLVLILSIVIASALEPLTLWARKRNIPRLFAVIAVYVSGAILLAGFFYFLLLPLIEEVSTFLKTLTIYSNSVVNDNVLTGMFETQNVFGGLNSTDIMSKLNTYLNDISGFLSQGIFSTASTIFGGVASFVLMLVLSFYLAVQEDGIGKFLRIIVPLKHEKYAINLWRRSQVKIGYWMQGQLVLGALVMILVYVALLIVGIPHALLLAVVAGVFELIPLFGATFAAIPAIFVAYTTGGMTTALIIAVIYIVIQQLENHVIYPMVVKRMVGVPAIVSILAIVIGGKLAGFLGVVISVPVAVVLMEYLSDLEQEKISKMAASNPQA